MVIVVALVLVIETEAIEDHPSRRRFGAAGEDEKEDENEKSRILPWKQGRRFADFVAGF
jgi:hypothetical protein